MLKLFKLAFVAYMFLFFSQAIAGEVKLNNNTPVFEILKWKSKENVSDESMIKAVDNMTADLKLLKGFLQQSLYKSPNGEWTDIYYWVTEEDAHASNASMADKESFKNLIKLIEPDSVTIEVMHQLQSSGSFSFK